MSWLSEFLHPGRAYDKAGQKEQEYYQQGQNYREPFINNASGAGNQLQEMMSKLGNPGALQDEWSKGYETSPYAQQLQGEAKAQGLDAAESMGLNGSSAALSNIQQGSSNIMQKDRQNYMEDMMKKYMASIGIGQGLYDQGANAAGNAANSAQQQGEWQGQNAYNKNSAGGNLFGGILGGAAGIAGSALGGPLGGVLASYLGNKLGAPTKWGGGY